MSICATEEGCIPAVAATAPVVRKELRKGTHWTPSCPINNVGLLDAIRAHTLQMGIPFRWKILMLGHFQVALSTKVERPVRSWVQRIMAIPLYKRPKNRAFVQLADPSKNRCEEEFPFLWQHHRIKCKNVIGRSKTFGCTLPLQCIVDSLRTMHS